MSLTINISGKSYPTSGQVLAPFHLSLQQGEFLCVLGPSGCGKTTFLHLIAALIEPDNPTDNDDAADHTIGYVFQESRLMPWLTALDNILLVRNEKITPAIRQEALSWLEQVGLPDKANSFPHQLSGGQKRRVALARAFFNQPSLLLMDEPFASLDPALARQLQELTLALWKKNNTTVVFVTHQLEEALLLGQRVILLGGRPTQIIYDQSTSHAEDIKDHYARFYRHPSS